MPQRSSQQDECPRALGRDEVDFRGNVSVELPNCLIGSNNRFNIDGQAADLVAACSGPVRPANADLCQEGWQRAPANGFDGQINYIDENYPDICDFGYSDFSDSSEGLDPGVYCLSNISDGEVHLSGGDNITGTDVTIIIGENTTLRTTGNAPMDITAPTEGPLDGVLVYGLSGSEFIMRGTPVLSFGCGGIIADIVSLRGTPEITVPDMQGDCTLDGSSGSGGRNITLLQ